MKLAKIAAALLILGAAALAIRRIVYEPYRCGMLAYRIDLRTEALRRTSNPMLVQSGARENLAELAPCLASTPWNVRLHMLAGANEHQRGNYDASAAAYARALEYDRRPEIEHALGLALLDTGRRPEAMRHLIAAALMNRRYGRDLPDDVRRELYESVLNPLEAGSPPSPGTP